MREGLESCWIAYLPCEDQILVLPLLRCLGSAVQSNQPSLRTSKGFMSPDLHLGAVGRVWGEGVQGEFLCRVCVGQDVAIWGWTKPSTHEVLGGH
jgi:hypothetical protein